MSNIKKETKASINILLAEDFEDSALIIQTFLKSYDISLDIVTNGKDAFEAATTRNYDLILMDTQMPIMDGLEAIKNIRKWETKNQNKQKNIIISLTANALKEDSEKSLVAGANKYLSRPVEKNVFLKEIIDSLPIHSLPTKALFSKEAIEEDFRDNIPSYIQNRKNDLEKIKMLLQANDQHQCFENINKICHRILGSAKTYGLNYLEKNIKDLQKAAKQKNLNMLKKSVDRYDKYIQEAIEETNLS